METQDNYKDIPLDELYAMDREGKRIDILKDFDLRMSAIVKSYPKAERDTWDIQQFEAITYLNSKDEADAPLLAEVLKGEPDGTTLEELCNRVLAKALPFKKMAGQLLAEKNKALRELEAITSEDENS